ncbi:hypothetical protein HYS29_00925, partial [Candidatus Microgenomates bacterium]|nr:hypothetical protein [Candidatus Microgenomates bacterium]
MGRVLSGTSYVLLFVLTPLAFLIMLSQNAIPGDLFYPAKRIFEKGILVAAAIHPTTRAMFHTNLSERRFYEAYTMLTRANTSGLDSFVEEIKTTQETIVTIVDSKQKQQLEEKLVAKIDEY